MRRNVLEGEEQARAAVRSRLEQSAGMPQVIRLAALARVLAEDREGLRTARKVEVEAGKGE